MASDNLRLDQRCIQTVRSLCAEMVYVAGSGHIGSAFGMAPTAHLLFSKLLNITAAAPDFINRDRFVLSNGHSCALLYSLLHLLGFKITAADLSGFRRCGSKTPGHPDLLNSGVEASTGALGQGVANAVGMAMAAKHLAQRFNRPDFDLIKHTVFVFCGDGDLMEGLSYEACSLAGHFRLDNLVLIYDDNGTTIDGATDLCFSEDVRGRFEALGWAVRTVGDGDNDLASIEAALRWAKDDNDNTPRGRPKAVIVKNTIGYTSDHAGKKEAHGNCMDQGSFGNFRRGIGCDSSAGSFDVPLDVLQLYKNSMLRGKSEFDKWALMAAEYAKEHPELFAEFQRIVSKKKLPTEVSALFEKWECGEYNELAKFKKSALRDMSGQILQKIYFRMPELIVGSADLGGSCQTVFKGEKYFSSSDYSQRLIPFGVREHAMFAISNGFISYGLVPVTSTFAIFLAYGFPALRTCAKNQQRQIVILSHDSISLGEDGPSHQPVETIALLRATPNLTFFRPANLGETAAAFKFAVTKADSPVVISVAKSRLFTQVESADSFFSAAEGAYVFCETRLFAAKAKRFYAKKPCAGDIDCVPSQPLILLSTGQDLGLALECAYALELWFDLPVRVVSCPSLNLFLRQSREHRLSVIPLGPLVVSVETSSDRTWAEAAHFSVSVRRFGESGASLDVMRRAGFSLPSICAKCLSFLRKTDGIARAQGIRPQAVLGVLRAQR